MVERLRNKHQPRYQNSSDSDLSPVHLQKRFKTTHVGDIGPKIDSIGDELTKGQAKNHLSILNLSDTVAVQIFNYCDSIHFISVQLATVCKKWNSMIHSYIFPTSEWLWCNIAHRPQFCSRFEYLIALTEQKSALDEPFRDSCRWYQCVKDMVTNSLEHYLNSCFYCLVNQFQIDKESATVVIQQLIESSEEERNIEDISIPFRLVKCNKYQMTQSRIFGACPLTLMKEYEALSADDFEFVVQISFEEIRSQWLGHTSHNLQTNSFSVPVSHVSEDEEEDEIVNQLPQTKLVLDELDGMLFFFVKRDSSAKEGYKLLYLTCDEMKEINENLAESTGQLETSYTFQFPPIHFTPSIHQDAIQNHEQFQLILALIHPRWDPDYEQMKGFKEQNDQLNQLFPLRVVHCNCYLFQKSNEQPDSVQLFSIPSNDFLSFDDPLQQQLMIRSQCAMIHQNYLCSTVHQSERQVT